MHDTETQLVPGWACLESLWDCPFVKKAADKLNFAGEFVRLEEFKHQPHDVSVVDVPGLNFALHEI